MRFSLLLSLIGPALGAIAPPQIPLSSQPAPVASASDFTTFQSTISPNHSIRIKRQNATLCDTPVDQYTGWLDVGHKHFFFWYFASENASPSPDSAPLALWMTGGPGGSSMIGLLLELGPCLMNKNGDGTVYNPYGWNKDTAMIFVDQPVGVGFSYSDHDDTQPDNSFSSAEDMQIFLQTFISQVFPVHLKGPFVITGESYAGHYIPTLGAQIVKQNLLYPHHPQVPLKSVAIGNGLISRPDTIFGYWETLCTTNPGVPEPVFNQTRCDIMAANMPRCVDILKTCNSHPDPALCGAAETVCVDEVTGHYEREVGIGGRNPYDITAPCDVDEICYADADLITKYLNLESSFRTLGVPPAIKNYSIMSPEVERAFSRTVDIQISTEPQVHYLLSNQVDVLIYQGNLDLVCNTAGAQRWASNFQWKGQAEFTAKSMKPWASVVNGTKTEVGTFKEVNIKMVEGDEKTTRFALVTVDGSGHMVPLDQPEVALDLLTRWLAGKSFD